MLVDTGIYYMPHIKSEWNITRLGYICNKLTRSIEIDSVALICSNKGKVVERDADATGIMVSEDHAMQGILKGDIAIHGMDTWHGAIAISNQDGKITRVVHVCNSNQSHGYIVYYLQLLAHLGVYKLISNGVRENTSDFRSWDKVRNIKIPLPPIEEQQAIADYLDKKIGEIDSAIKEANDLIDKYKSYKQSIITKAVTKGIIPNVSMKDSGLPWIGEIPEHWEKKRGKYILSYLQKPIQEDDEVITCFRDGEVTLRSNRREEGFTISEKEIGYQGIDINDLVIHGMDGFAGAIGISDSRGKASPVLVVLDSGENKRYLMYYLRSLAYRDVFLALATGIRVRSCDLRWNKIANTAFIIPPIEEQQDIADYLDDKCAQIDSIIESKNNIIKQLQEYKKSIIFEYVTGKKEVPNG